MFSLVLNMKTTTIVTSHIPTYEIPTFAGIYPSVRSKESIYQFSLLLASQYWSKYLAQNPNSFKLDSSHCGDVASRHLTNCPVPPTVNKLFDCALNKQCQITALLARIQTHITFCFHRPIISIPHNAWCIIYFPALCYALKKEHHNQQNDSLAI